MEERKKELSEFGHEGVRYIIKGEKKMQPIADYIHEHIMEQRCSLGELLSNHKIRRMNELYGLQFRFNVGIQDEKNEKIISKTKKVDEVYEFICIAQGRNDMSIVVVLIPENLASERNQKMDNN